MTTTERAIHDKAEQGAAMLLRQATTDATHVAIASGIMRAVTAHLMRRFGPSYAYELMQTYPDAIDRALLDTGVPKRPSKNTCGQV